MAQESDYKRRVRFRKMVRESSVEELLRHLFPGLGMSEREEIVEIVRKEGVCMGAELRQMRAGALAGLGVSEWVCKALAAKNIIQPGLPPNVYKDGYEVMKKNMSSSTSKLDHSLFALSEPSLDLLLHIQRHVRSKSWLQLAEADMDPEESQVVNSLFNSDEVGALYGYRALLRIIAREAPVLYQVQDDQCFLGTFYFAFTTSSASGSTRDWSKVVWVLQAVSKDIEYLEGVGRMVQALRKMFAHQTERKFAYGVVAGANLLDIYMFSNNSDIGSLVAECVDRMMFALHQPRCFAALVHLMCVAPPVHGFLESD